MRIESGNRINVHTVVRTKQKGPAMMNEIGYRVDFDCHPHVRVRGSLLTSLSDSRQVDKAPTTLLSRPRDRGKGGASR
jgi:hypothetical protein